MRALRYALLTQEFQSLWRGASSRNVAEATETAGKKAPNYTEDCGDMLVQKIAGDDGIKGARAKLTFTFLAHQLHQMPRFVDEEKVTGIVKILSFEVFCPELQLDLVVAHPTGIHHAFAEIQCDLLRWSEGQYYGLRRWEDRAWLDHRSATRELPRIFGKRGNAEEGDDQ